MSPPPPPAVAPPPKVRAQASAKLSRSERRAARALDRHRRHALRLERRAQERRSLVGPLLLVALGSGLLVVQQGSVSLVQGLLWFAHWWPLVLVLAGLVVLGEWAFDARRDSQELGRPRRRLGLVAIALLILVTLAGSASRGLSPDRGFGTDARSFLNTLPLDNLLQQHTDHDLTLVAPLPQGEVLQIRNGRGKITIVGSSPDDSVHVASHQRLSGFGSADLQQRAARQQPKLIPGSNGLELTATEGKDGDITDFSLQVPHDVALDVSVDDGDVSVREVRGPVKINTKAGDLELTALAGEVTLATDNEDTSITGHSLSGRIQVEGRAGDLSFSDVEGSLSLRGEFFGTTELARVIAPVAFTTSLTDFHCAAVKGKLHIEGHHPFEATELTGPVTLTTSDRSAMLHEISGPVTINDQRGAVAVSLAAPLQATTITTTHATVSLAVPESLGFDLAADTTGGAIESELAIATQQTGNRAHLSGRVHGGGPHLQIRTTEADIHLFHGALPNSAQPEAEDDSDD